MCNTLSSFIRNYGSKGFKVVLLTKDIKYIEEHEFQLYGDYTIFYAQLVDEQLFIMIKM